MHPDDLDDVVDGAVEAVQAGSDEQGGAAQTGRPPAHVQPVALHALHQPRGRHRHLVRPVTQLQLVGVPQHVHARVCREMVKGSRVCLDWHASRVCQERLTGLGSRSGVWGLPRRSRVCRETATGLPRESDGSGVTGLQRRSRVCRETRGSAGSGVELYGEMGRGK